MRFRRPSEVVLEGCWQGLRHPLLLDSHTQKYLYHLYDQDTLARDLIPDTVRVP